MQAQLDWPVSALLVLYSCVVPQARHAVSPSSEKCPAAQVAHTVLLLGAHAPPLVTAEPAAHTVQFAHGDVPEALHVEPATQLAVGAHTRLALSQKKPDAQEHEAWPASVPATYAAPVPQGVQLASPAREKESALHTLQLASAVVVQGVDGKEPAEQTEQAAQGGWPVTFQFTPATQGRRTHADTFHEYEAAQAHELWPVRTLPLAL